VAAQEESVEEGEVVIEAETVEEGDVAAELVVNPDEAGGVAWKPVRNPGEGGVVVEESVEVEDDGGVAAVEVNHHWPWHWSSALLRINPSATRVTYLETETNITFSAIESATKTEPRKLVVD
jgi:hypothetical protein